MMKNGKKRPRRPRALVAGAAGFIGSHLCDRLLADGYRVCGVDNLLTGRLDNLAHLGRDERFELAEADVVDALPSYDDLSWVFHLASPASPPAYRRHSMPCLRVNSEGTRNLLQLALANHATFLLASTSEVYGDPLEHPQAEAYWGNVNPVGPRSMYDEAKRFAESMTIDFRRVHRLPIRIVRIFNTYGPRMDPDDGRVVSNLLCQALRRKPLTIHGNGTQTRSFQYVDDLVESLVRLMDVEYQRPLNLGNPDEYTINQLVALVCELVGVPVQVEYRPLPGDDPKQRCPDTTLATKLLRCPPRIDLREGLRRTLAYFEQELGLGRAREDEPSTSASTRASPILAARDR